MGSWEGSEGEGEERREQHYLSCSVLGSHQPGNFEFKRFGSYQLPLSGMKAAEMFELKNVSWLL